MDFGKVIIKFLGLKDVVIEDIKQFEKDLRAEIVVRQFRLSCFCPDCGGELKGFHEWVLKELKGPPMGIYQVKIKFWEWLSLIIFIKKMSEV